MKNNLQIKLPRLITLLMVIFLFQYLTYSKFVFIESFIIRLIVFVVYFSFVLLAIYLFIRKSRGVHSYVVIGGVLLGFIVNSIIYSFYENPLLIIIYVMLILCVYESLNRSFNLVEKKLSTSLYMFSLILFTLMLVEIYSRIYLSEQITEFGRGDVGYYGSIYRLSGNTYNPNRWSGSISVLMFSLFFLYLKTKQRYYFFSFLVVFLYGFFSFSKTFIISSLLYVLVTTAIFDRKILGNALMILIFFGGIFYNFSILPENYTMIFNASLNDVLSPLESNTVLVRFDSYTQAIIETENSPIIGVSLNALEKSPHNNLLAHYSYFGLFGLYNYFIIFVLPYFFLFAQSQKVTTKLIVSILLVFTTLSMSMSSFATDIVAQTNYAICLLISIILIKNYDSKTVK